MATRLLIKSCLAAACFFPLTASAADTERLVRQFVELQQFERQYEDIYSKCLAGAKAAPPESFLVAEPDKFYGIRPGSKCWPKVVEAYETFNISICSTPTKQEFLDALARSYAAKLTPAQLRKAIAFYSTDAGRKLIAAHTAASEDMAELFSMARAHQAPKSIADLDRKLQAIAAKNSPETTK